MPRPENQSSVVANDKRTTNYSNCMAASALADLLLWQVGRERDGELLAASPALCKDWILLASHSYRKVIRHVQFLPSVPPFPSKDLPDLSHLLRQLMQAGQSCGTQLPGSQAKLFRCCPIAQQLKDQKSHVLSALQF